MGDQLSQNDYDPETGYAVKQVPPKLFDMRDKLVSDHLDLKRAISSYKPSHYNLLIPALK